MSAAKKHFGPKRDVAQASTVEFSGGFVRNGALSLSLSLCVA